MEGFKIEDLKLRFKLLLFVNNWCYQWTEKLVLKNMTEPQLSFLYKESLHIGLYLSYMHCPFKELSTSCKSLLWT